MPTTFLGLFLVSTALSLIATFAVVGGKALFKRLRPVDQPDRVR